MGVWSREGERSGDWGEKEKKRKIRGRVAYAVAVALVSLLTLRTQPTVMRIARLTLTIIISLYYYVHIQ